MQRAGHSRIPPCFDVNVLAYQVAAPTAFFSTPPSRTLELGVEEVKASHGSLPILLESSTSSCIASVIMRR